MNGNIFRSFKQIFVKVRGRNIKLERSGDIIGFETLQLLNFIPFWDGDRMLDERKLSQAETLNVSLTLFGLVWTKDPENSFVSFNEVL
jgi:hypothetical protein